MKEEPREPELTLSIDRPWMNPGDSNRAEFTGPGGEPVWIVPEDLEEIERDGATLTFRARDRATGTYEIYAVPSEQTDVAWGVAKVLVGGLRLQGFAETTSVGIARATANIELQSPVQSQRATRSVLNADIVGGKGPEDLEIHVAVAGTIRDPLRRPPYEFEVLVGTGLTLPETPLATDVGGRFGFSLTLQGFGHRWFRIRTMSATGVESTCLATARFGLEDAAQAEMEALNRRRDTLQDQLDTALELVSLSSHSGLVRPDGVSISDLTDELHRLDRQRRDLLFAHSRTIWSTHRSVTPNIPPGDWAFEVPVMDEPGSLNVGGTAVPLRADEMLQGGSRWRLSQSFDVAGQAVTSPRADLLVTASADAGVPVRFGEHEAVWKAYRLDIEGDPVSFMSRSSVSGVEGLRATPVTLKVRKDGRGTVGPLRWEIVSMPQFATGQEAVPPRLDVDKEGWQCVFLPSTPGRYTLRAGPAASPKSAAEFVVEAVELRLQSNVEYQTGKPVEVDAGFAAPVSSDHRKIAFRANLQLIGDGGAPFIGRRELPLSFHIEWDTEDAEGKQRTRSGSAFSFRVPSRPGARLSARARLTSATDGNRQVDLSDLQIRGERHRVRSTHGEPVDVRASARGPVAESQGWTVLTPAAQAWNPGADDEPGSEGESAESGGAALLNSVDFWVGYLAGDNRPVELLLQLRDAAGYRLNEGTTAIFDLIGAGRLSRGRAATDTSGHVRVLVWPDQAAGAPLPLRIRIGRAVYFVGFRPVAADVEVEPADSGCSMENGRILVHDAGEFAKLRFRTRSKGRRIAGVPVHVRVSKGSIRYGDQWGPLFAMRSDNRGEITISLSSIARRETGEKNELQPPSRADGLLQVGLPGGVVQTFSLQFARGTGSRQRPELTSEHPAILRADSRPDVRLRGTCAETLWVELSSRSGFLHERVAEFRFDGRDSSSNPTVPNRLAGNDAGTATFKTVVPQGRVADLLDHLPGHGSLHHTRIVDGPAGEGRVLMVEPLLHVRFAEQAGLRYAAPVPASPGFSLCFRLLAGTTPRWDAVLLEADDERALVVTYSAAGGGQLGIRYRAKPVPDGSSSAVAMMTVPCPQGRWRNVEIEVRPSLANGAVEIRASVSRRLAGSDELEHSQTMHTPFFLPLSGREFHIAIGVPEASADPGQDTGYIASIDVSHTHLAGWSFDPATTGPPWRSLIPEPGDDNRLSLHRVRASRGLAGSASDEVAPLRLTAAFAYADHLSDALVFTEAGPYETRLLEDLESLAGESIPEMNSGQVRLFASGILGSGDHESVMRSIATLRPLGRDAPSTGFWRRLVATLARSVPREHAETLAVLAVYQALLARLDRPGETRPPGKDSMAQVLGESLARLLVPLPAELDTGSADVPRRLEHSLHEFLFDGVDVADWSEIIELGSMLERYCDDAVSDDGRDVTLDVAQRTRGNLQQVAWRIALLGWFFDRGVQGGQFSGLLDDLLTLRSQLSAMFSAGGAQIDEIVLSLVRRGHPRAAQVLDHVVSTPAARQSHDSGNGA